MKGYENEEEEVSSYLMTLNEERILGTESGSTRLHSVEN
jgi:hypothetical protein